VARRDGVDAADRAVRGEIERYGWAMPYVAGETLPTSFAHTAGLQLRSCPSWWSPGCRRSRRGWS
jgi:hypothetical protein